MMKSGVKKNLETKPNRHVVLFKIISRCNDFCDFCLEYKFIKSNRLALTPEELKKNYFYLKKKYRPEYFILTGGEPTLHPQFLEILEFLKRQGEGFRFITNLLKFNDKVFLKKLELTFSGFRNKKQENLSKIIVSINDLAERSAVAKRRFSGLEKALLAKLPLMVTVMIYRGNLKDLAGIARRLKSFFKRRGEPLYIEFRLIYIQGTSPLLLEKSLPVDFLETKKAVEAALKVLRGPKINVTLWNFPLCYLDNPERARNEAIAERQARRLIKIHKDAQLRNAETRDWEIYLKASRICQKCSLGNYCSGIDRAYIEKYHFPQLKPIL